MTMMTTIIYRDREISLRFRLFHSLLYFIVKQTTNLFYRITIFTTYFRIRRDFFFFLTVLNEKRLIYYY